MTLKPPRRYRTAVGTPRRRPRVRRASAGLSPVRAGAILTMLIATGAIYGLSATAAFGFGRLQIEGALLTSEDAVRAAVAVEPGTNLVGLSTAPIAIRLRTLPSVANATISVGLPDSLVVSLTERRPVVIWGIGSERFAVDATGLLFADVSSDPTGVTSGIPVVDDQRAEAGGLTVGAMLDTVVLDAATRLGSLTPSQIGSTATALRVVVTDERGFTVTSGKDGWVAVFGFYGQSQRTPALIPGQVQLLAQLLVGRESRVETVILADDRDGTFIPKPTPRPSASTRPSAAP
jgi:hypothetical protein